MKESFLHYIWQFQQFVKTDLATTDGDSIEVFEIGNLNTDAGPDFNNCKIRIGEIVWHGHVEIHVKSGDWLVHGHEKDRAYDNVVLHVVWEEDKEIVNAEGKRIPTLRLNGRVSDELISRCNSLVNSPEEIPCSGQITKSSGLNMLSMQQQVTIERLSRKSADVLQLLEKNVGDWEETAYQLLAKNFGFKINSDSFQRLAENLPLKILKKHSGNLLQLEALLFGMAGFLDESPTDQYHSNLMNEYEFLASKYSLKGKELAKLQWKYLRLRPANFPTVRIAQLAAFIYQSPHLFDRFSTEKEVKTLKKLLRSTPSDYWREYYNFGKESTKKLNGLGSVSAEVLIINTVVPILAAYSQHVNEQSYMDRAVEMLEGLKAERNHITDRWEGLGTACTNAFESQAMIELYNSYCLKKKCLSCKIGVGLLHTQ